MLAYQQVPKMLKGTEWKTKKSLVSLHSKLGERHARSYFYSAQYAVQLQSRCWIYETSQIPVLCAHSPCLTKDTEDM